MEIKVIVYIIAGILYFFFSMKKKMDEKNKKSVPVNEAEPEKPKTVSPPSADSKSMQEVLREIKRKQAEQDAKKNLNTPKPVAQKVKKVTQPAELLIREKKAATFGEGKTDEPVYEDLYGGRATNQRGDIRLENEGIYKIQTMEEAREEADKEVMVDYAFDAKQAFIGSIILERKY